ALSGTAGTSAIGACVVPPPEEPAVEAGADTSIDLDSGAAGETASDATASDAPEIVPGGPGSPCDVDGDCTPPLICDPSSLTCSDADAGSDSGAAADTSADASVDAATD